MSKQTSSLAQRPPVVAILGHVDHGKSTLLDTIRKANTVEGEAGGITQHIAAYEVEIDHDKTKRTITFIDTPGHAAFSGMRKRGAAVADIAVLIVAADDSVKTQTIEAIETIKKANVPYVVAINKIDKPEANVEKVKTDLLAHEVFVEGFGGDTPVVELSAKTGKNISDLLETIVLLADLHEFITDPEAPAEGFVIESHLDEQRGVSSTLVVKNGEIKNGQFVVAGAAMSPTRLMVDHTGKAQKSYVASAPITLIGFNDMPAAGEQFKVFAKKKDAEKAVLEAKEISTMIADEEDDFFDFFGTTTVVPIILKTDTAGTREAIEAEIAKLSNDDMLLKIIKTGLGSINESDMRLALADQNTVIVGFNSTMDKKAARVNNTDGIQVKTFSIIYELTDWLEALIEERRPRKEVEVVKGNLEVLRVFSIQGDTIVAGGRITEGEMAKDIRFKLIRRGTEIAQGRINRVQIGKKEVDSAGFDQECGLQLQTKYEVIEGDVIQAFAVEMQ